MKCDVVAPEQKVYKLFVWRAKILINEAPMNLDIGQDLPANSFRSERLDVRPSSEPQPNSSSTRLKIEDKSSRNRKFKFKRKQ